MRMRMPMRVLESPPNDEVAAFLEREPVRHNLIVTLLAARAEGTRVWQVVDEHGATVGVALRTRAGAVHLSEMPPEAGEALAAKVRDANRFYGPGSARMASLAAGSEVTAGSANARLASRSGLFRLERVHAPRPVTGVARLASGADVPRVWDLVRGFQEEIGETVAADPSYVEGRVEREQLWVWEDGGQAVAMAAWTAPAAGVVRINLVYTPPSLRNRGYAGNLVAAIAQTIVDRRETPILYTDLANPTSNRIYRTIGFEQLAEIELWEVTRTVPPDAARQSNRLALRWAESLDPDTATVFAPAAVWPLLAMLAEAAGGQARDELKEVAAARGPEFLDALRGISQVHSAMAIWVRNELPLTPQWAERALPLRHRDELDAWVSRETGGLIERMPAEVDQETLLLLAGALTVSLKWTIPFDVWDGALTRESEDLDAASVVMTPAGPVTRLLVQGRGDVDVYLFSDLVEGLRSLLEPGEVIPGSSLLDGRIEAPGIGVEEVMSFDSVPDLYVETRPFEFRAGHDLLANAALFGLEAATDRDRGHFPGISDFPLAVSAARQDAIAAFHAEGFEAAAVTAFDIAAAGLPHSSKKQLRVTFAGAFGFAAVHRTSGLVLTAGRVQN